MFNMIPNWEFASRILEAGQACSLTDLRELPSFFALLRHQKLSGNPTPDANELLSTVLKGVSDRDGAIRVLEVWKNRENNIIDYARDALRYLPSGTLLSGRIFFVVGYDIGIVAPPDVAINLAHPHFIEKPGDVGHYVTHEVHHLGFLSHRSMPSIPDSLCTGEGLLKLIFFMTQMEGMAVHAAYDRRKKEGHLKDDDYRIYINPDEAMNIRTRFWKVCDSIDEKRPQTDQEISTVLNAMSSGERLWYRYGALVSEKLESDHGLDALKSSVQEQDVFRKQMMDLRP